MTSYEPRSYTIYGTKEVGLRFTQILTRWYEDSNVVKNNGKNTMKRVEDLVKWNWVLPRKNWDTVSLNPIYKEQIKQYVNDHLIEI